MKWGFALVGLGSVLLLSCGKGQFSEKGAEAQAVEQWLASQRIDGLCSHEERIVFQCVAGDTRVAICGGIRGSASYLQFRQRTGTWLIAYPANLDDSVHLFRPYSVRRSMGGESHIAFVRDGRDYDLYAIDVGASTAKNERDHDVRNGLSISQDGAVVEELKCTATEVPIDLASAIALTTGTDKP